MCKESMAELLWEPQAPPDTAVSTQPAQLATKLLFLFLCFGFWVTLQCLGAIPNSEIIYASGAGGIASKAGPQTSVSQSRAL